MKEHPILFNTKMVKANMDGWKTNTRRIIKPQPIIDQESGFVFDGKHRKQYDIHNWKERFIDDWSRLMPGDLIWTRECWNELYQKKGFVYSANSNGEEEPMTWRPSIHMPKEAARIWMEITNIKIERLHEISEDDIIKEGVRVPTSKNGILFRLGEENSAWDFMPEQWKLDRHVENRGKEKYVHRDYDFLFAHWAELWCAINGRESWDANPWVWVVEYKILSTTGKPVLQKTL